MIEILSVKEKSDSVLELSTVEGPVFILRTDYLCHVKRDELTEAAVFSEEKEMDILDAGFAFAVERKALDYLSRAEQSRFSLTRKLLEKKYEKNHVNMALDYLEQKNYLSDRRFARSWLNARRITKYEGRTRLLSELLGRFISREIAVEAVNEFFEENDEMKICTKAAQKLLLQGKSGDKLLAALQRAGFSYRMIKDVLEELEQKQ